MKCMNISQVCSVYIHFYLLETASRDNFVHYRYRWIINEDAECVASYITYMECVVHSWSSHPFPIFIHICRAYTADVSMHKFFSRTPSTINHHLIVRHLPASENYFAIGKLHQPAMQPHSNTVLGEVQLRKVFCYSSGEIYTHLRRRWLMER